MHLLAVIPSDLVVLDAEHCNATVLAFESHDGNLSFGAVQLSFFTRSEQTASRKGSAVAVSASTPSRAK